MAKAARYDTPPPQAGTASFVAASFTSRIRAWAPLAAKFTVFFAIWILGAYFLNERATTGIADQLSAVAFWFGWLFASVAFIALVAMIFTGVIHDLRNPIE